MGDPERRESSVFDQRLHLLYQVNLAVGVE